MNILNDSHREQLSLLPIKYAFFDVDGTLKNSKHQISDATTRAVRGLRQRGIGYGLASGRPYFGAREIIGELQVTGPSVFFSGALVIEPHSEKILHQEALAPADIHQVLNFARKADLFVELYTSSDYFAETISPLGDIHALYLGCGPKLGKFEVLMEREPILKLEFVADTPKRQEALRAFAAETKFLHFGLGYGASHPELVFGNVTSLKASRDEALRKTLEYLKLTKENIAAFGDAEADVPFLKAAAFGVAMGNAPLEVQRQAGFTTKTVDEDGVAYALGLLQPKTAPVEA